MHTGENARALQKILDWSRIISLALLLVHFYDACYPLFAAAHLQTMLTDRILFHIRATGLLSGFNRPKWLALAFLLISLLGGGGKKEQTLRSRTAFCLIAAGLAGYFLSRAWLYTALSHQAQGLLYMFFCLGGYLAVLSGGTLLSRVIRNGLDSSDIFNRDNETFPQEERLLENEYSVNLPASYHLRGQRRSSWINIINPFRALLVMGSPGSGKSYYVIRHVITQHIQKGFSMFVYDFKFDDLSLIAYNHYLKYRNRYPVPPRFYVINFEDLSRSHRCNPLDRENMLDITDASESARTIMMGLNREWIRRQGDFFVESPINFLTAIIWFLRRYRDGRFCTLPHVIELMQLDYDRLFTILQTEKQIEALINPFVSAYLNDVMEQLEGQIASAKISMARLSSPQLYYVLSGNDFSLDINNPLAPKIVCMGNNPQKIQVYGAVLSLYVSRLIKSVNKKGKIKCSLVFDEFPTLYINNMDSLIATARSNRVATTLGVQDFSQLKKDYGRDQADVIINITGNIISGQVAGETARQLSERFGKIMQDRTSMSVNRTDTTVSHSRHLDAAIPASRIASLSSGEFVGLVADDPQCLVENKLFHNHILNDHPGLDREQKAYQAIPPTGRVTEQMLEAQYARIRQDVEDLVTDVLDKVINDPSFTGRLVKKRT